MARGRVASGATASLVVLVVIGFVVAGAVWLWHRAARTTSERCTASGYELSTDQTAVASSMVGVAIKRGLPERASVLLLAAGLQESKLRNLPSGSGDRDSVGVLQQRPSQGWGTVEQLSDVRYAAGKFLDVLVKIPNWRQLPLAEAIQHVQNSADQEAYARHEAPAQAFAAALTGANKAGLSCQFNSPTQVAAAATVASQLVRDLPVREPNVDGVTVRVPGASWPTAAWFVANANRLGIDSVTYAGQRWTRTGGWKTATTPTDAVVARLHKS